jgi:hypothetical protein
MLAREAFLHAQRAHGMDIRRTAVLAADATACRGSRRQSVLAENVPMPTRPTMSRAIFEPLDFDGILRDQASRVNRLTTNAHHIVAAHRLRTEEATGEGGRPTASRLARAGE